MHAPPYQITVQNRSKKIELQLDVISSPARDPRLRGDDGRRGSLTFIPAGSVAPFLFC